MVSRHGSIAAADGNPVDVAIPVTRPPSSDSGLQAAARGGAVNVIGAMISALCQFALVVVVARALHAGGAGAFFEATSLLMVAANLALVGTDTALVRFIAADRATGRYRRLSSYLRVVLLPVVPASIAVAVALFFFAHPLASVLAGRSTPAHVAQLTVFLRSLTPCLPIFVVYLLLLAATRGFGTMVPNNAVDKIGKAALQVALVAVAAIAMPGHYAAVTIAWIAPIVMGVVPAAWWLRRLTRRSPRAVSRPVTRPVPQSPRPRRSLRSRLWRFAAPRGLASLLQAGLDRLDILLLGAMASASVAGVYAAATRFLVAGRFFSTAITQGVQPQLGARFAEKDHAGAQRLYKATTIWTVALTWPAYLIMVVFASELLRVFGGDFRGGVVALQILAGTTLIGTACGSVDVVLLMGGRSTWNLANTALALVANVTLNLALIPRWGLEGAAVAWGVALVLANVVPLVQVALMMRMHPFSTGLARVAASATVSFGLIPLVVRLLLGDTLAALAIGMALAGALYLLLLWYARADLDAMVLRPSFRRAWSRRQHG